MIKKLLPNKLMSQHGFTLIEVMMVISLWVILFAISIAALTSFIPRATLTSYKSTFLTDLKSQQTNAINGYADSTPSSGNFGIYIENSRYTLFEGDNYLADNPENIVVTLDSPMTISSTFGSNIILFEHLSGEIINFVSGNNAVTLSDSTSDQQLVINLNQYGVITQAN